MSNYNALRAVANRLTTCATEELPYQVGFISTSIASCSNALSSKAGDDAVSIHKIRTKTSALLQDRTPEGRLSGIVITRALIEAGGIELLGESGNWVRSLITCLNKSDAWETKRLCVLTITRIYLLTKDHQALVREITTPTLPAFVIASLNSSKPTVATIDGSTVRCLSPLLPVVLRSWTALIQQFAPTFRPSIPAIKSICLSLLSDPSCPTETQDAASTLLGRLHFCAAKNSGATEWIQTCSQAIEAAHDTIDLTFRAIVEDWTATSTRTSKVTRKQRAASIPATSTPDALALDKLEGVTAGCQRIEAHIGVLTSLITENHSQEVNVPFGSLLELTSRLSAITPPTPKFSLRINNEVTRDEREELWLNIPRIHSKMLVLFIGLIERLSQALLPAIPSVTQQAWDIFESQTMNLSIRVHTYKLFVALLRHGLLQIEKADSANFKRLISACCLDIKEYGVQQQSQTMVNGHANGDKAKTQLTINLEQNSKKRFEPSSIVSDLYSAAWNLLPVLLERIPFHVLSGGSSLRAQIDSQAVVSQHHDALLASVLYPLRPLSSSNSAKAGVANPSLLPFAAQAAGSLFESHNFSRLGIEALLRPRFPVIESLLSTTTNEITTNSDDSYSELSQDDEDAQSSEDVNTISKTSEAAAETSTDLHVATTKLGDYTASKRDFTAILEASADAQLAASAANELANLPTSVSAADESAPATKRQRIGGDAGPGRTYATDSVVRLQSTDVRQNNTPGSSLVSNPYTTEHRAVEFDVGMLDMKDKQPAIVGEDSDSDSDIPPIDATLAVLTDSEDEADE